MIRINLLSVKETEQALGRRQQRAVAILGLLVVALCMIIPSVLQTRRLKSVDREVGEVQREVMRLNEQVKEVDDLKKLKEEIQAKLSVMTDLDAQRSGPARVLMDLSSATPEKLWLTDFTETSGAATIVGIALDNETVANFMRQLNASPFFYNVDLDESATVTGQKAARTGMMIGADFKRFALKARIDYLGKGGKQPKTPTPAPGAEGKKGGKKSKSGKKAAKEE